MPQILKDIEKGGLSMLFHLENTIIPTVIHLLEGFGIFIIIFASIKAFIKYAMTFFNFNNDMIKIELAKALALGLEFKLGSEILKTVLIRSLDEMYILGAIIFLRVVLTFVIHWEIEQDTKHCNLLLENKEKNKQGKVKELFNTNTKTK